MYLKPGCEKEYAKRHAAIWPELKQMIKEAGVSNYSIFWDKETNILFAYQECSNTEMVGHDGRHHGGQPRQLSRHHPHRRALPHGLNSPVICRNPKSLIEETKKIFFIH